MRKEKGRRERERGEDVDREREGESGEDTVRSGGSVEGEEEMV
jgi:hypothetical protein